MRIPCPAAALSSIVRTLASGALAFLVAACAFTEWDATPAPPPRPELAALAGRTQEIFKGLKLPGAPEVTAIRPAHPLTLADFVMCLRSDAPEQRQAFALLIQSGKISGYRTAVGVDQCDGGGYAPLDTLAKQEWRWDVRR